MCWKTFLHKNQPGFISIQFKQGSDLWHLSNAFGTFISWWHACSHGNKVFFLKIRASGPVQVWWGHIFLVSHPNAAISMAEGATRDGPQLLFRHHVQKDHDQHTTPFWVLQYSMTSLSTLGSGKTLLFRLWLQVLKHCSCKSGVPKSKHNPK